MSVVRWLVVVGVATVALAIDAELVLANVASCVGS
jgi:hypothetical protein